jgi:phytoene dehydrogenase-like protein
MEKKIVIIGAGIAGLSAGCYARMNGYDAEIYEMHSLPGGLCTSWKKGRYTIDGCLHWLTGSAPADSFYQLWNELGAISGRKMYDPEEFYRFTGQDGRTFVLYCDADRLEKHMKDLSGADTVLIEKLCRLIRKFASFRSPQNKAYELFNFFDIVGMIWTMRPYMKDFNYCSGISTGTFAAQFADPLLRETIPMVLGDKDMSLLAFVITMALLHNKAGGFPEGGSLEFARAIEKRFLNLGGRIYFNRKVEEIIVKEGKATGIKLEKGEVISGDYVISCADLHTTVFKMLEGKYIEPQHEELFNSAKIFQSSVQVSFGINMDLSGGPGCIARLIKLTKPVRIGNSESEWFMYRNFSFDRTMAPEGKSVVECTFAVNDFEYWEKLYSDRTAYKAEKERIARMCADELEAIYPGFISSIEITDILSPMTYVRYTGNYRGAYMTWVMTPDILKRHRMVKKTLPGLENLWLAGMWVQPPGGVPTGAKTSRDIIQLLCRKDHKKFKTTVL